MSEQKSQNNKSESSLREEAVLDFWKKEKIFEKSLEKESPKGEFVFFEGPPTANGKPGLHHLEARAFKDVIPRYKTMQGFHVRRKGGWDTHGLPVEIETERKHNLTSKKQIEEFGIARFNEECKKSVWAYKDLWEKFTDRIGYWVDQENPYITYENDYIESIWNIVGKVEEKGLLYKDYKVLPWCPRCGTALSSHELAQGYQDVKDLSVYAKFKLKGEEDTYLLAWTTTPWTLPGNVGLAIGRDIEYVKVESVGEKYILAKQRLSVLPEMFTVLEEMTGDKLIGMEYEPLYPYLNNLITGPEKEKLNKAYKVYEADFVNITDGTGIVHTAVMYGQDDFVLGTEVGLPKFHLVDVTGHFINGTDFLEGRFVKDEEVAIDIIKDLAGRGILLKKEKYEHSYPFCWRCKTPLIYYARDSWYIRMSELKDKLVAENNKINWEPAHIKEGRFGEWIREIKDWALSRERFWGTPLPIWEAKDGERMVVDSFETLRKYVKKSGNNYFVMRHGGTEGNKKGIVSFKNQVTDDLTEVGIEETKKTAEELKLKNIDLIISSPFTRTKHTANIVKEELGLKDDQLIFDERLAEVNPGEFDGSDWEKYHQYIYETGPNWFDRKVKDGESLKDVYKRVTEFLFEIEEKYKGKNILILTHGGPAWVSFVASGLHLPDKKEYKVANTHVFVEDFKRFDNSEFRELPFVPFPHNDDFDLDPHKPYIDQIVLEKDGKEFTRVKEVMDVWFDSGAMPFAQDHYPFDFAQGKPFENKELAYPADFISEAIDQTRGWFYTLLAIGVLTGKGTPYKNVICLGHLLDKDGKKMSKSVGNVVDPWEMIEKYGVDTLRMWMFSVTQPGDSKNFDERTVVEINRQVFGLLYNVLAFYELYRDKNIELETKDYKPTTNILDQWILEKLKILSKKTAEQLDNYKIMEPARAMRDFMDDLSTWYLRRSRDRIKEGDVEAKQTLYFVLKNVSKILAPFAPFTAEDIWQKLKNEEDEESIHLASWPEFESRGFFQNIFDGNKESKVIEEMESVREIVTKALQLRQKANIKVRQPLSKLRIKNYELGIEYTEIIKDEINVKDIVEEKDIIDDIELDIEMTEELKLEGDYREFLRGIQDMRKKSGLMPNDKINLDISDEAEKLIKPFLEDFKKTAGVSSLEFKDTEGEEIKVNDQVFKVKIK
ncbi:MAG TPA: class I tRNA ligase family protein [Candidatus Paceibacterota bacterium]|nr:class I tRNA ligase family protein [Candidatus Paceibacterota bacterium]